MTISKRPLLVWITFSIALLFGLMTIKSGGSVLFIDGEARLAAGNYVPFVLWFNFIAGFFYVITGIGIYLRKKWAERAAIIITALTLTVFAALGFHILNGGEYEQRTVIAMCLRSFVWASIAFTIHRHRYDHMRYRNHTHHDE